MNPRKIGLGSLGLLSIDKKIYNTSILALYLYISNIIGHTNFTFVNRLPKVGL
jgi:hypothetical protein